MTMDKLGASDAVTIQPRRPGRGATVVFGIVAISVIAAAIVQSGRPDRAVTAAPVPTPTSPTPLRVPYVTTDAGGLFLQDGGTRVPIPRGVPMETIGRVADGWFVIRGDAKGKAGGRPHGPFGLLRRSGGFERFGTAAQWAAALSPDGKLAAVLSQEPGGRVRLVVVDVRTGDRPATTLVDPNTHVIGWNDNGIWFRVQPDEGSATPPRTSVWRPGSEPRHVRGAGWLQFDHAGTRFLEVPNETECVKVMTLGSGARLVTVRQFCQRGLDGATLSPDGRRIVLADGSVHMVDGGPMVRIREPSTLVGGGVPWEDDTHVLLHDEVGNAGATRHTVDRCDVRTGVCEQAFEHVGPIEQVVGLATR